MAGIILNLEELERRLGLLKEISCTSDYQQGLLRGEINFIQTVLQQKRQYFSSLPKLTIICQSCENKGYFYDYEQEDDVGCPFCPN